MLTTHVRVTMSESVTYEHTYSVDDLARLLGCTVADLPDIVRDPDVLRDLDDVEVLGLSSDPAKGPSLLDDMVDHHLLAVENRRWDFRREMEMG